MARLAASLRDLVRRRANDTCEYCQMPHEFYRSSFQPDHIIAAKHKGRSTADNLCWTCFHCNLHKGANLSGIDPRSRKKVWLFNPRRMKWARHFRWHGPLLVGRTAIGRATVEVLKINDSDYVETRAALLEEGVFPP